MSKPRPKSVDDLSLDELRDFVVELLARLTALEEENAALKDEELARYFSIGNSVVVVWDGKVYKVTSE